MSTLLTETLFHASSDVWTVSITRTLEITAEIGVILYGAFFFLEVAKKTGVIDSLATLLKEVNSNRVVQGILLTFPMELMIEGSSGFGTPLLVIAPLLMALQFDLWLCIILPFINCLVGTPFGALGTPIRLAFLDSDPSRGTVIALAPLLIAGPLLTHFLISKKIYFKESIWILSISALYFSLELWIVRSGIEFVTLVPAFVSFCYGILSARLIFKTEITHPLKEKKGIVVYGILLTLLWIGKQLFLDRTLSGTHIRIFNPGYVFIALSLALMHFSRAEIDFSQVVKTTFARSKRTLAIFFCMTFVVQQMRNNGGLEIFTRALPEFFLGAGAPILAWLGCIFIGTSTVTNLLFSKVLDPVHHVALAAGSAIGIQLAFQSLAAMKSATQDQFSEKEIFLRIAPISIGFIFLVTLWCALIQ